jgi:CBS domain-containing protein
MAKVRERSVLSGILVREVMRRQVVQLPGTATISNAVNHLIRHRSNALLVTDAQGLPHGVVSKTDIMGAFYAALPNQTPLSDIAVGPPFTCFPDDELESSLDLMKQHRVHRLYVMGAESKTVIGTLAYPDIVGQMYRYCRSCIRGLRKNADSAEKDVRQRALVKDVMTPSVVAYTAETPLSGIVEGLFEHAFAAVLIRDDGGKAAGVISKTDIIIAYHHGLTPDEKARAIMSRPVQSCHEESLLADALRQMLLRDIQRLFVHAGNEGRMTGVLSLSDAAQYRSGTCRACMPSRLMG